MLIKRIDGSTRQLGAPADWDGKDMSCGVLPILDVQTTEGNFMFSAWEPTPPELDALNKGANILLGVRGTAHPVVSLQVAADADVKHPDDVAVDQFAEAMKAKLADARAKGRSGWQDCDPAELSYMLREHVEKGDPRDVANFCMFLWSLGKPIGDTVLPISGRALPSPQEGQAGPAGWRIDWPADHFASVGGVRFIGKDDPVAKDRLVSLGATAVPLYASQLALPAGPVHAAGNDDMVQIQRGHLAAACYALRHPERNNETILAKLRAAAKSPAMAQIASAKLDVLPEFYRFEHVEPRPACCDEGKDGSDECCGNGACAYLEDVERARASVSAVLASLPPSPAVAQPVADERGPLAAVTRERVVAEIERVADVYGLDIPDTAASKATEELVWQVWRALCQPAEEARPADCTRDPQCCPQNEGHGCDCSKQPEGGA